MDITQFNLANPWRSGAHWEVPSIKRDLLDAVLSWLDEPEILVLSGARQVGKTSLVYQIIDYLLNEKDVAAEDIYFFNLDLAGFTDLFDDQGALLRFLDASRNRNAYVIVDEVQRLENPGIFFKALQDLRLPFKFILTGSSTLDIRAKTSEALTGRKKVFSVAPLNFSEYLNTVGWEPALDSLGRDNWNPYANILNDHLKQYALFGGYPAVTLTSDRAKKIQRLEEIYTSYLDKEIAGFLQVTSLAAFRKLCALVASQQGALVNIQELSNTLGIHRDTVTHFLDYLKGTFITTRLSPFFTNPHSELSKMPKIYFNDPGLRNFAMGVLGQELGSTDLGQVIEGLVLRTLIQRCPSAKKLNYWRSTSGAEVDFVIADVRPDTCVEVKSGSLKQIKVTRGYRSFLKKYAPSRALLLCNNLWESVQIASVEVEAYPLALFLGREMTPRD